MTQIFDAQGRFLPVTVLEVGPCRVVQNRTKERHGYNAVQIGFGKLKEKKLNKPQKGFFAKLHQEPCAVLKEFRLEETLDPAEALTAALFQTGDMVDVEGITKGRGFQGVMKRHNMSGGPDSHGAKRWHRRAGSIGQNSKPSRVFKNLRMPGRMGNRQVLTRHLKVAGVDAEKGWLLVRGAVPGRNGGMVVVYGPKDFEKRLGKKKDDSNKENKGTSEAAEPREAAKGEAGAQG